MDGRATIPQLCQARADRQSRDDMSGVREGQERPLNQLITLSLNSPSSHSLTLMAVCAIALSRCNE